MDTIYFFKLKNNEANVFFFGDQTWVEEYFDMEAERIIRFLGYAYKKKQIRNKTEENRPTLDNQFSICCNIDEKNPAMLLTCEKPRESDVLAGEVFICYK